LGWCGAVCRCGGEREGKLAKGDQCQSEF
jgi:hypothetical protein